MINGFDLNPFQENKLVSAIFKISDARSILQSITKEMESNNQFRGLDDIKYLVNYINESTLDQYLKDL